MVDTLGLLVLAVTTASVQDGDGGARVLDQLRFRMPSVVTAFADGGYSAGWSATPNTSWGSALVKKPGDQQGLAVLPRRWVVERTFA